MSFRSFMLKSHRWLGVVMSIFFVMWFTSGLVLVYHSYPSYHRGEQTKHLLPLRPEMLPSDSSLSALRLRLDSLYEGKPYTLGLEANIYHGVYASVAVGNARAERLSLEGDTLTRPMVDRALLDRVASLWSDRIERIDTITDLDQWTPFSRLERELPFYRLSLEQEGREVYVSSVDGRVITEHTSSERLWAWLGAIPHWVYFTWLRRQADLWIWVIIVLAGIGVLMVLTGIYVGIDVYRRSKGPRGYRSPYKKRSYYLHHVLGLLSGIFIFGWIFSGLMSVVDLPEWMTGSRDGSMQERLEQHTLPQEQYQSLPLAQMLAEHPETRSLRWRSVAGRPFVELMQPEGELLCYRADRYPEVGLALREAEVLDYIRRARGEEFAYQIELMEQYDGYYVDRHGRLALPVYRVDIDDPERHAAYLNPETLELRLVDHGRRLGSWFFSKPHALRFAFLAERPWLWTLTMWSLMLLGLVVSVTGLMLSYKAVRRSCRRRK
ncbi:PepSY domain-containing protein [Porphyromonas sp. COT-239 OH1446]|uniref:PepSY domain-containing protein n=1 Tax=Porphyromonas sp. COT-239 OH1446 TaxID=1515613 RepID=UPI0009DDBAAD|nr:PepSY domain-containing protein [Porphyromonas sp. COT-239 OH1446]